jgi:competence protein ComEC
VELGPVVALAALVVGILAGQHAGPSASTGVLFMGVLALALALVVDGRVRVAVAAIALAALGFACTARALDGEAHSPFAVAAEHHDAVVLDGVLTNDPAGPQYTVSALLRTTRHRIVLVRTSGDDAMRLRLLEAGDRVTLSGRLTDVHGNARWQHAAAELDQAQLVALRGPTGLLAVADRLRNEVLGGTQPLPPTPRALVAGFLLGDTRGIPPDVTTAYRNSGLSHLLAVSGENLAFVLAVAGPLLRRLRLGARTTVALGIILLFAAMTRFEPSVLRASMMATIGLLATFAGRPASRVRILCYAIIVLLVADPFLLHSVAFLLSCGASAGIAFASPAIARRIPGPRALREPLAVSLGAQIGVMPVLVLVFGSFPLVTPLTNLVAAPAAEAVGVYGFVASAAAGVVPAIGPLVQLPTRLLAAWITAVARAGAAVPMNVDGRGLVGLVAISAAVASVACARGGRAVPESSHQ